VTLVSAAGNGATDYTKVIADASSPDFASFPGQAPRSRTIEPSCISMPSEGEHVIAVSSTGISTRKAYYSDYGNGYVDVASPGGDVYDTPDQTRDITKATLSAYPKALAVAKGEIDANGDPTVPYVVKDCSGSVCAYYQYLQGTSMASPRAAGVAALIVSKYGHRDPVHGGLTLAPSAVESVLKATATRTPCPSPAAYTYTRHLPDGTTATETHTCEGTKSNNGFYGRGIVDALRAVGR
jgi:subtilisin family serine protease